MKLKLKPLNEQVIVITGADSGIGLATARMAAREGASLVLNSRNAKALKEVAGELRGLGARVEWHAGDVADEGAMRGLAATAVKAFGRIDTWINNAGVSIYGQIDHTPVDEARRLFETNYFGVVNGSLAALPHLKAQGGALINLGSVLSGVSIPLQGHYSASKHAVKGFTDSLRQELAHEKAPVSVTLIRPAGIDTPYTEHAKNHMPDADPTLPPPVYAPEVVAKAILNCARRPQREVLVGGAAKQMEMLNGASERLFDVYADALIWDQQKAPRGSKRRHQALDAPSVSGREEGDYDGHVMGSSAYTAASQSRGGPSLAVMGLLGAGLWWLNRNGTLDQWNERLRTTLFGSDAPSARNLDASHAHTSAEATAHGVYEPAFPGSSADLATPIGTDAEVHGVFEPEFAGGGQS
jgi:short-subunit dehydrogenase